jgi:hypothetical protein
MLDYLSEANKVRLCIDCPGQFILQMVIKKFFEY